MPERRHEVTRLEGFSDTVFAIALALLVVQLEVPKDMHKLDQLARGFIPFAAMFAMVCWIWYEHNRFFRRYGLQDARTVFLNAVLLFLVLFYVYPLKFLTLGLLGPLFGVEDTPQIETTGNAQELMLLYSGGLVMIFGTFVMLFRHARSKRAELALTAHDEITLRFEIRSHAITLAVGLVSMLLASVAGVTTPWLLTAAGFFYFALGPLHAWNGTAQGRALRALEGAPAAVMATVPKPPEHAKR